ncbi:MAG: hypothetical protein ACLFV3_08985, partial [Phycisphaeraceae bacterium]
PRLFFKKGRSTKKSNGFLFVNTRLTSLTLRFRLTTSSNFRFWAEFEPRHLSTRFWLNSNVASAALSQPGRAVRNGSGR